MSLVQTEQEEDFVIFQSSYCMYWHKNNGLVESFMVLNKAEGLKSRRLYKIR